MIYKGIVHLHSTLAILILLFLLFRLYCRLANTRLLNRVWVKAVAHFFDFVVIILGVVLLYFNHWVFYDWLIVKLVAIAIYILATFYAMKKATSTLQVILFGVLSIGSLLVILGLAYSKSIFFL